MNTPKPSSRFFQNRDCEFFPCHSGVDPARFSCLLCYCPLYALGRACGGSCAYTAQGIKDCSGCAFPHQPENYDRVLSRFGELADVVRRIDDMKKTGDP